MSSFATRNTTDRKKNIVVFTGCKFSHFREELIHNSKYVFTLHAHKERILIGQCHIIDNIIRQEKPFTPEDYTPALVQNRIFNVIFNLMINKKWVNEFFSMCTLTMQTFLYGGFFLQNKFLEIEKDSLRQLENYVKLKVHCRFGKVI